VKKRCNNISAFHYLTFHKKPREVNGPYDKLSIGFSYIWFIPRREIKPQYKERDNFHDYIDTFFGFGNKIKIIGLIYLHMKKHVKYWTKTFGTCCTTGHLKDI
jgi:hypothetical protein